MVDATHRMTDEFYKWLEACPVQWFRNGVDESSVSYQFVVPDEMEDECPECGELGYDNPDDCSFCSDQESWVVSQLQKQMHGTTKD